MESLKGTTRIIAKEKYCNQVMDAANQLFNLIPELILFNYSRIYPDGSRILLSSNSELIQKVNLDYNNTSKFNLYKLITPLNNDLIIVSEWAKSLDKESKEFYTDLINRERKIFNYSDESCVINFEDNYIEIFHYYCTNTVADPVNFFINLRKLLQQFAIKFIHDHKSIIDCEAAQVLPQLNFNKPRLIAEEQQHYPLLLPKKFYLKGFDGVYLTNAELKCAIGALNGKNNQEIGDFLGISVRTVEVYMDSMRKKIGCERRNGIIQYLLKNTQNAYLVVSKKFSYKCI